MRWERAAFWFLATYAAVVVILGRDSELLVYSAVFAALGAAAFYSLPEDQ